MRYVIYIMYNKARAAITASSYKKLEQVEAGGWLRKNKLCDI